MDGEYPVTKKTHFATYVKGTVELEDSVVFYNDANTTTESNRVLIPVDSRTGYGLEESNNCLNIEYTKNTGTGIIKSIIFGRSYASDTAVTGLVCGEVMHLASWIIGRTGTVLKHLPDRTQFIKTTSSNYGLICDLLNKDYTLGAAAGTAVVGKWTGTSLSQRTNAASVEGHAGFMTADNRIYRCAYQSHTSTDVTVRVSIWTENSTAVQTKDVVFPIESGEVYTTLFLPVAVYKPVSDTIEIYLATSVGQHDLPNTKYTAHVQKCVLSNLNAPIIANVADTVTTLGYFDAMVPGAFAVREDIGYYDHITNLTYIPCATSIDPITGAVIVKATVSIAPGGIFDGAWQLTGDYIAKSIGAGGFISYVRTDKGVIPMMIDTATMYYPQVTQVLSGVVLAQEFEKTTDNILRILYQYKLI